MNKPTVIVILGPTASGKTSLAVELALKLNGEIISADSMQIYRDMDIATAKPTIEQMKGVKHHLIDMLNIDETFSAAKFKQMALEKIDEIFSLGKTPIVAGGTGLYIDTLINNTVFIEGGSKEIREQLETKANEQGIQCLITQLKQIDPETANAIHINNTKRIIRALELYYSTGYTMTQQRQMSHLEDSWYDFCLIGLASRDRQFLYNRINSRVDEMMEQGLLDEAKKFYDIPHSATAVQAIGYKELKNYFDGKISLEEAVEYLKMQTRRYAKRQLTWFKRNDKINWLYIDELNNDELLNQALKIISDHLKDKNYET